MTTSNNLNYRLMKLEAAEALKQSPQRMLQVGGLSIDENSFERILKRVAAAGTKIYQPWRPRRPQ